MLGLVIVSTGALIMRTPHGDQEWGELIEVPLMSAMFLAMVWHARRRQEALREPRTRRPIAPSCSRGRNASSTTSRTSYAHR